jgi:hypothetical protein
MKQFSGFEAKKTGGSSREILPAGGYVCTILSAKEEVYSWGSKLAVAVDVDEGEYKGFFKKDFDGNDREDRKWRGTFRLTVPNDDGSEQDDWNKRKFGNFVWAVQESNPGYVWNWGEKTLKGKKVGLIWRNKEWEVNGRTGWTTEAGGSTSVENIREGKYRLLKELPLKNRPKTVDTVDAVDTVDNEDDLPF